MTLLREEREIADRAADALASLGEREHADVLHLGVHRVQLIRVVRRNKESKNRISFLSCTIFFHQ